MLPVAGMALGSAIGGLFGMGGQAMANSANAEQADKQMGFQERMANSAYQRSTADMKAAGINPMLAYMKGGADSPGGASAQMGNIGEQMGNSAKEFGLQYASAQADIEKKKKENELLDKQTRGVDLENQIKAKNIPGAAIKSDAMGDVKKGYEYIKQKAKDMFNNSGKSEPSHDKGWLDWLLTPGGAK
jgi:hypothetical protein